MGTEIFQNEHSRRFVNTVLLKIRDSIFLLLSLCITQQLEGMVLGVQMTR